MAGRGRGGGEGGGVAFRNNAIARAMQQQTSSLPGGSYVLGGRRGDTALSGFSGYRAGGPEHALQTGRTFGGNRHPAPAKPKPKPKPAPKPAAKPKPKPAPKPKPQPAAKPKPKPQPKPKEFVAPEPMAVPQSLAQLFGGQTMDPLQQRTAIATQATQGALDVTAPGVLPYYRNLVERSLIFAPNKLHSFNAVRPVEQQFAQQILGLTFPDKTSEFLRALRRFQFPA